MLVIGLTGPSGAGKGEVSRMLREFGIPVIDADEVYHALLVPPSPCLDAIGSAFGKQILRADGTLDRKALSAIVFSDPAQLQILNRITHSFVMERIRRDLKVLAQAGHTAAVMDAPQLFEAGADADCQITLAVLADRELRIRRIMQRDGLNEADAVRRIDAQRSDDFFRARADYVLENNADPEQLRPAIERILTETGVLRA